MIKTTYVSSRVAGMRDLAPTELTPCASCASGGGVKVFGEDPDGLVLCRECRRPLSYCDVGGQG